MEKKGHQVLVTGRDKDVVLQLLEAYHIPHRRVGRKGSGKINLIIEWVHREIEIFQIAREFNPDILMGVLNPAIAHVAKLLGKPSVIFTDSEPEVVKYPIADLITIPFSSVVLTLNSVKHDYGKKEVRINSYKELASLHPNLFTPDPQVLETAGIVGSEDYALVRFVSWGAYHDVGQGGFNDEDKRQLIQSIEKYLPVYISSESPLPKGLEKHRLPIPPHQMHDFLYYAKLLVSDSQTMTTEAAVLGTPAVRCNSFVGDSDMGNFIELEKKYGLIFNCQNPHDAIQRAIDLAQLPDIKQKMKEQRTLLLNDKVCMTSFLVWFIENYPISVEDMREHPEVQHLYSRGG